MKTFKTLLLALTILATYSINAQVAITTDGSDPNASSMLDVKSTDKGFLPPRVANTSAVSNPTEGLMVYDLSSHCLKYYNGTAWSDCIGTFNLPPVASSVTFSGTLQVGESLTGSYSYSDNESDIEGASTFQWYRADDGSGTNQVAISGATAQTYVPVSEGEAKHLAFEVTPVAQTGTTSGTAVMSTYQGPVEGAYPSGTVHCIIGGTDIVDVTSATGEIWMDRNLGATQVATSATDVDAIGDLYQWGRLSDGHQCRGADVISGSSTNDIPGHDDFLTNGTDPWDWRDPQNDNLWQGASGTNNPCPNGYRLPTQAEWEAERLSWGANLNATGALASPLKLPMAGWRNFNAGNIGGGKGQYWSSTIGTTKSKFLDFDNSSSNSNAEGFRADGRSVRCIKDD